MCVDHSEPVFVHIQIVRHMCLRMLDSITCTQVDQRLYSLVSNNRDEFLHEVMKPLASYVVV